LLPKGGEIAAGIFVTWIEFENDLQVVNGLGRLAGAKIGPGKRS